ncbi:MAG TPA: hypothetical protein VMI53_03625 [Opitutaceae bacterium]|nr:hypothetical protein [Opitutaceae bacterium]
MNASLHHSSSVRRTSAARFSASRRSDDAGITSARPHAVLAGYSYSSIADAGEDFFSQIWTPGLLDRLQAPLTRYRE